MDPREILREDAQKKIPNYGQRRHKAKGCSGGEAWCQFPSGDHANSPISHRQGAQEGDTVAVHSIVARIGRAGERASETRQPAPRESTDAPRRSSSAATGASGVAALDGATSERRPPVSPFVRKLAREHDVDVATIRGTGPGNRVTKDDILAHVGQVQRPSTGTDRVEPMTVMRRTIAERMVTSRRTSAHVHTVFDVDFTHIANLRDRRKGAYEQVGAKLTYLSFVAKAIIDSIAEVPVLNASVDRDAIVYQNDVNLGIAVALDPGLIVPVIKQAQNLSLVNLSRAIGDLAERARAKKLTPSDVERGTFTITNPGTFGSIFSMPIINQPQLAILNLGAVERRPVVVDDAVTVRRRAYLTLGFDHRIIDGAVADRFMATVKSRLEDFDEDLV